MRMLFLLLLGVRVIAAAALQIKVKEQETAEDAVVPAFLCCACNGLVV
jgi:hypothetical protein